MNRAERRKTFNPIIVRFKRCRTWDTCYGRRTFNPIIVRFKPNPIAIINLIDSTFNPIIVRFKPYGGVLRLHAPASFQSYHSSIQTLLTDSRNGNAHVFQSYHSSIQTPYLFHSLSYTVSISIFWGQPAMLLFIYKG